MVVSDAIVFDILLEYMLTTSPLTTNSNSPRTNEERDTKGPFFVAYQNLPGRCSVCKHGGHVINIPKADWSRVKNKQLTATLC